MQGACCVYCVFVIKKLIIYKKQGAAMNELERDNRIRQLYSKQKAVKATFESKSISTQVSKTKTSYSDCYKAIEIPGIQKELFHYQKVGVGFLVAKNGRAIIGDFYSLLLAKPLLYTYMGVVK